MKRSARANQTDRISLFPFLAVLICTMGALLVLLVVMSQHAQAKAAKEQAQASEHVEEGAIQKLEDLQMWIEQWKGMQADTQQVLARRRAELAHLEDHMRRLKSRLEELKAAFEKQAADNSQETSDAEAVRREIERIKAEIAEANQQIEKAGKQAAKKNAFAIIPYEGPNHTRRRPIYLECGPNGVTLQPEGILLEERDFIGPLGPANPLASAVRAASTYWLGMAAQGHDVGQPYPLLLVRSDGIGAYYAARAAMKSWEMDFGYELIGNDWDLEFSTPDARLADAAQQAVDAARQRRERTGIGSGRGGSGTNKESPFGRRKARTGGFGRRSPNGTTPTDGDLPHDLGNEQSVSDRLGSRHTSSHKPPGVPRSSAEGLPEELTVESMADSRGKNWASPGASKGLIPFTRTMSIQVAGDRIVIIPQNRAAAPELVMLAGETKVGVEEFVSKVWEEMKDWGSAGRGMYWRPEIQLQVLPGGERRAYELGVLLEDSGLDLAPAPR